MAKNVIDDGIMITINVRWLIQLVIVVAMAVYGFWQLHARIAELERSLTESIEKIESIEYARNLEDEEFKKAMEAQISWFEKELNLNPFSWGKNKK